MIYTVKVNIKAHNPQKPSVRYSPLNYKGEFLTEKKKVRHSEIERQVKQHVSKWMKAAGPELDFNITITKIERCQKDFIIAEE